MIDSKIRSIIKEIFSGLDYERVILFGSRSRGNYSEKSDFDILLILKKNIAVTEKIKLSTRLRKTFAQKGIDADIIVKSSDEVKYYKDKVGNVVKTALLEGIPL